MAYSSQSHCFDHNHPIGHFQQPTGSCVRFSIPQIETYQQLFSGLAGRGRPSRGLFCNDLQCHGEDYWKVEFWVSVLHNRGVNSFLKVGGQVVMWRAAAAPRCLLFCQNMGVIS